MSRVTDGSRHVAINHTHDLLLQCRGRDKAEQRQSRERERERETERRENRHKNGEEKRGSVLSESPKNGAAEMQHERTRAG